MLFLLLFLSALPYIKNMRKFLITIFISLCLISSQTFAEDSYGYKADNFDLVDRAQSYLQTLKTARADFIQTSYNGAKLDGTFYINRPGKLRFEYNKIDDFIVADGFFIYFYDSELQQQTNAPIGQTLAAFLLRKEIDLKDDLIADHISENHDSYTMRLSQKSDPEAGNITLVFTKSPFDLKKWFIKDAHNYVTEIELFKLEKDVKLDKSLFVYRDPMKFTQKTFND